MEQINCEAVVIAHRLALLIRAKYAALGKLYAGLVVLVVLAALLLALYTGFALTARSRSLATHYSPVAIAIGSCARRFGGKLNLELGFLQSSSSRSRSAARVTVVASAPSGACAT
jgi:hypothetical protein